MGRRRTAAISSRSGLCARPLPRSSAQEQVFKVDVHLVALLATVKDLTGGQSAV